MIAFTYTLTTYTSLLHEMAAFFGVPVIENTFHIPDALGTGFFKVIDLGNGIEAIIYDLKLTDELLLTRKKENKEYYTLVLDETQKPGGMNVFIENEKLGIEVERNNALYLTSFLFEVDTVLHKNVSAKGMRVLLSLSWMQQYLQLKEKDEILEKYIELKTKGVWNKSVDAESKELLDEILKLEDGSLLSYQNKILRIVEKFFSWLYDKTQALEEDSGISRQDIVNAQKIESILTSEDTVIPPTINQLSKEVAMSESKLKKIFKTVYGLPPYEYFQKHRMQKARLMLLSGRYSIKDVGYTLGYSNLSNFTLAFKKAFGKLPSELTKK